MEEALKERDRAHEFAGKSVLVTGGSRGIGAAVVEMFSTAGAAVTFSFSSSQSAADELVLRLRGQGGVVQAVRADNGDVNQVHAAVDMAVAFGGSLDILVNNAGLSTYLPIDEFSTTGIERMFDTNVLGAVHATQRALESMGRGGRVINIGSVNAVRMPWLGGSVYSSTKAALAGFARGLARELGPRGITINTVLPGPIDTETNPANGSSAPTELGFLAVPRFGTAREVAALVEYLAGSDAAFVTGAEFLIDGGFAA